MYIRIGGLGTILRVVCLGHTVVTRVLTGSGRGIGTRGGNGNGSCRGGRRTNPAGITIKRDGTGSMLLALAGRGDRRVVDVVRLVGRTGRHCGGRHGGRGWKDGEALRRKTRWERLEDVVRWMDGLDECRASHSSSTKALRESRSWQAAKNVDVDVDMMSMKQQQQQQQQTTRDKQKRESNDAISMTKGQTCGICSLCLCLCCRKRHKEKMSSRDALTVEWKRRRKVAGRIATRQNTKSMAGKALHRSLASLGFTNNSYPQLACFSVSVVVCLEKEVVCPKK